MPSSCVRIPERAISQNCKALPTYYSLNGQVVYSDWRGLTGARRDSEESGEAPPCSGNRDFPAYSQ